MMCLTSIASETAPAALVLPSYNSGSLAMLAAMRHASSLVSRLAAARSARLILEVEVAGRSSSRCVSAGCKGVRNQPPCATFPRRIAAKAGPPHAHHRTMAMCGEGGTFANDPSALASPAAWRSSPPSAAPRRNSRHRIDVIK